MENGDRNLDNRTSCRILRKMNTAKEGNSPQGRYKLFFTIWISDQVTTSPDARVLVRVGAVDFVSSCSIASFLFPAKLWKRHWGRVAACVRVPPSPNLQTINNKEQRQTANHKPRTTTHKPQTNERTTIERTNEQSTVVFGALTLALNVLSPSLHCTNSVLTMY